MFFLVIVVVAVAVGALIRQQQSKHLKSSGDGANTENAGPLETAAAGVKDNVQISDPDGMNLAGDGRDTGDNSSSAKSDTSATSESNDSSGGLPKLQESAEEYTPVLSAKPISSPNALGGATYTQNAPASSGTDSPYSYGNKEPEKKSKPAKTLLRWCGRMGSLQVEAKSTNPSEPPAAFLVLGPITYWSEGISSIQEPSCIDITLPVEYLSSKSGTLTVEKITPAKLDYKDFTPLQRGLYLTWLAGGRIQPPLHSAYPTMWIYGLERRVLADRLDLGLCFSEAFRLLPLVRWEPLQGNLIKFITWLAIKIWMPEDELIAFCRRLQTVPESLLGLLLGPYANAKLALPAGTAFTLMRTSQKLREAALAPLGAAIPEEFKSQRMVHSDELQQKFTPMYRNACSGGLKFEKPKRITKLTYTPTNPSLAAKSEVVEIPDFFDDLTPFEPLFAVWRDFITGLVPQKAATAAEQVEDRPDLAAFIENLTGQAAGAIGGNAGAIGDYSSSAPVVTTFGEISDLLGLEAHPDGKVHGRERKAIADMARVEGYHILPNPGLSGRDYFRDDKILLLHLDLGAKLSMDYNAAAFLLEICCAMLELRENTHLFEPLRQRMNDYFGLSTEDNLKLDAQQLIDLPTQHPKNFYGDLLQFVFQDSERCTLRNFLLNLLNFIPETQLTKTTLTEGVCGLLGVTPDAPPALTEEPAMKRGQFISKLLAGLFKDV